MATSGDFGGHQRLPHMATSGDFLMAMDIAGPHRMASSNQAQKPQSACSAA